MRAGKPAPLIVQRFLIFIAWDSRIDPIRRAIGCVSLREVCAWSTDRLSMSMIENSWQDLPVVGAHWECEPLMRNLPVWNLYIMFA